jgi:hypothetical protein
MNKDSYNVHVINYVITSKYELKLFIKLGK